MAVAGGAPEGVTRPLLSRRHELQAAVDGISTDVSGMVLPALLVSHHRSLLLHHRATRGGLLRLVLKAHAAGWLFKLVGCSRRSWVNKKRRDLAGKSEGGIERSAVASRYSGLTWKWRGTEVGRLGGCFVKLCYSLSLSLSLHTLIDDLRFG